MRQSGSVSESSREAEEREFPSRGLMQVPEPADAEFVARVMGELAEARERCLQVLLTPARP